MKRALIYVLTSILLLNGALALDATHMVSNSENWEDVYSTLLYGSLKGISGDFLTSTAHGPILLNGIAKSNKLGIVTSSKSPFVFNYKDSALQKQFAGAEEIEVDSANLELIDELPDIKNFIIVDDSYGYSAIAVTPYAVQTKSWVFLANRVNIAEIEAFLERRGAEKVLIYGYVDREVDDALDRFNPQIINTGDRFQDNVEIVKEFLKIKPTKQIILTNGEFIEKEIMAGNQPCLFTGRENVPDQIRDYLKESEIEVGVLIGNELINAATNIRRSAGISVMVKFAQGARGQAAGVAAVEGLDLFYLPTPQLDLGIYSIKYNKASEQVEVTYQSKSNVPIYIKGTVTAIDEDGKSQRAGDLEPIFMAPNDYKTIIYPGIKMTGEKLTADLFTLFGEIPTALDRKLEAHLNMSIINFIDKCEIDMKYLRYNKQNKGFYLKIENTEDNPCYVDLELSDVKINNLKQTIGTEGSTKIEAKSSEKIFIDQRMSDEDLDDNPFIWTSAYYGEKEDALVKTTRKRFELEIERFTFTTKLIIALVIILILIILFIIYKRRKEDDWNF